MTNNNLNQIPFTEVKTWIKERENSIHTWFTTTEWHPAIWELIDGCESFTEDYCKSPHGFAETDNMHNPLEVLRYLNDFNFSLLTCDKKELKEFCKFELDKQRERFAQGKNSTQLGRHLGRLRYLLS